MNEGDLHVCTLPYASASSTCLGTIRQNIYLEVKYLGVRIEKKIHDACKVQEVHTVQYTCTYLYLVTCTGVIYTCT